MLRWIQYHFSRLAHLLSYHLTSRKKLQKGTKKGMLCPCIIHSTNLCVQFSCLPQKLSHMSLYTLWQISVCYALILECCFHANLTSAKWSKRKHSSTRGSLHRSVHLYVLSLSSWDRCHSDYKISLSHARHTLNW